MKTLSQTLTMGFAILLLGSGVLFAADKDKERDKKDSRRGGKAATHMSEKGKENTNAQWYADPDRGWIRADERRDRDNDRRGVQKRRGTSRGRGEDY